MTSEQAAFLRDMAVASIEGEMPATKRVIAAIPEDKREYKPDPKARTAYELAWHIAVSEAWFLEGVINGEFKMEEPPRPADVNSAAAVADWYEKTLPALLAKVREVSPENLVKPINFYGIFNHPAVVYLNFDIVHTVHHRGQLAAYLRPMGSKVPSIYGGSADEPFEMAAQA